MILKAIEDLLVDHANGVKKVLELIPRLEAAIATLEQHAKTDAHELAGEAKADAEEAKTEVVAAWTPETPAPAPTEPVSALTEPTEPAPAAPEGEPVPWTPGG